MSTPHHHEPEEYICPFCDWLAGNETEYKQNTDIVFQDELVTAFISPKWWPNNPGHVIIIPNQHIENIYDMPDDLLATVYSTAKRIAITMRDTYNCDGTSTRQHNEPAGNQDVWHFHVHIFPRYKNDQLYAQHAASTFVDPAKRAPYAQKLRKALYI